MSKLLLFGIMFLVVAPSPFDRRCSCQEALEHDLPHGANELIEYSEKTVKSVSGRVAYFHDDSAAEDVVVEIYEITPADAKLNTLQLVQQRTRKFACITSKDGSFCFPHLPAGRYLVRAGTRSRHAGMNEVYMRVKVDRRWWSRLFRPNKKIKLSLTLVT